MTGIKLVPDTATSSNTGYMGAMIIIIAMGVINLSACNIHMLRISIIAYTNRYSLTFNIPSNTRPTRQYISSELALLLLFSICGSPGAACTYSTKGRAASSAIRCCGTRKAKIL